jgi:putative chitobiose transport system permease protein
MSGSASVSMSRPAWMTGGMYALGLALAALAVGPAAWLVLIALKPNGTELTSVRGPYTLANFIGAWQEGGLGRPMLTSILVTLVRAGLNVLLAALAAYPLSRMSFKGRDAVMLAILMTMMIPEQVIVVPMFKTVVAMGLYDTLLAVIVPFSVSAFGIFMCRQAFLAVPVQLEEAARLDGAGALRTWWHVMVPLSAPTLATLGLFSVIASWSDLLWPLIVLQSKHNFTLPVAVNELMGVFSRNMRYAYAGSVLALLPIIVAFVLSQRWFRPQIFAGAVKG